MLTLADLEGRWSVTRDITDARADLTGHFNGISIWSPIDGGLMQAEDGTLTYGAAPPMQATRRYVWRQQGRDLQVFFDDGRPFHTVPAPGEDALHDCPPDTYRVRYDWRTPDSFATTWHVTGPRKNARLHTIFTRAQ